LPYCYSSRDWTAELTKCQLCCSKRERERSAADYVLHLYSIVVRNYVFLHNLHWLTCKIVQIIGTRIKLAYALAKQWFGIYTSAEEPMTVIQL